MSKLMDWLLGSRVLHKKEHGNIGAPSLQARTVLIVGDSISIAGVNGGDNGLTPGAGVAYSGYAYFTSRGWWCEVLRQAGWPLRVVDCLAVGGKTLAQIRSEQLDTYTGEAPDWLFFNGGVNNTSTDLDTMVTDLLAIYKWAEDRGINVMRLGVTPVNSSDASMTSARRTRYERLNEWDRDYCQRKGHLFLDPMPGDVIGLPTSATSNERSGAFISGDVAHPSCQGAQWLGKAGAALLLNSGKLGGWKPPGKLASSVGRTALSTDVSITSIVIASGIATVTATAHGAKAGDWVNIKSTSNNVNQQDAYGWHQVATAPTADTFTYATTTADGTLGGSAKKFSTGLNLYSNPLFAGSGGNSTGTTGTVTGTIPDDVRVTCSTGVTVACSTVAHTRWGSTPGSTASADQDNLGNWLELAITGAVAGSTVTIDLSSRASTDQTLRIHPGNYYADIEVELCGTLTATPRIELDCYVRSGPSSTTSATSDLVELKDGTAVGTSPAPTEPGIAEAHRRVLRTPRWSVSGWVTNYITKAANIGSKMVKDGNAGITSSDSNYTRGIVVITFGGTGGCTVRLGRAGFWYEQTAVDVAAHG